MRPADLCTAFGEKHEQRTAVSPCVGFALSAALHCALILLGMAVWRLPGEEGGPAGGGGTEGKKCMMVDLAWLPGTVPPGASAPEAGRWLEHSQEIEEPDFTEANGTLPIPDDSAVKVVSRKKKVHAKRKKEPAREASVPKIRAGQSKNTHADARQDVQTGAAASTRIVSASASAIPGSGQSIHQGLGPDASQAHRMGVSGSGTGGGARILGLGDVDSKPRLIHHVEPEYPESARKSALSGKVMARFVVDESGAVHDATISSADPPDVFDLSVLEAVQRWRFEPARYLGKAVRVMVTVPVRFDIAKR